jgi:hypothetical protein
MSVGIISHFLDGSTIPHFKGQEKKEEGKHGTIFFVISKQANL